MNVSIISQQVTITRTLDGTRNLGLFLNDLVAVIKMLHWYTNDYNFHKITDKLYKNLADLIDSLMEELIQITRQENLNLNLNLPDLQTFKKCDYYNTENENFVDKITNVLFILSETLNCVEIQEVFKNPKSGLQNTKDEILTQINQTLYLLNQIV
jgi:DNA-binding ferritin-like protein